ncbi:MAG: hypothetical protein PVF89_02920 [Lysobacterales bacterium]|jgi:hypothetical protein
MKWATIKRWSKISLRTLHLLGVAGVGGGVLLGLEQALWLNYWYLALLSGTLMMLMDVISNRLWLVQVRGLAVTLKLVLLVLIGTAPAWDRALVVLVIVISSVISHAPGAVRYYSLYHRRVINSSRDIKG